MSKKTDILAALEAGKEYGEIETETGAKRQYIRSVAAEWRKANAEPIEPIDEADDGTLNIVNDLGGKEMVDNKTGKDYHNEWVNEKAYECECGCTLNRKSTFCPHCGISLDWSDF